MASDEYRFDFPPLFQDMRLNIEGGPMYRGGRSGRAAAAYYREKEAITAIKNKYGNRYGRRIQSYKPDTEAWKPERYRRSIDTLSSRTAEILPGGLQNKMTSLHIHHDWTAQAAASINQQGGLSLRDLCDKYSSETSKSEGVPVTTLRLSHTVDMGESRRPSQQGRGMMRGKRAVDLSALYCADGNEELTVTDTINPEKGDLESYVQKRLGSVKYHGSNQSQKELGSVKYHGSNQFPSELIKSDGKEELTENGVINQDKRELQNSIRKERGSMDYHGYNHSPSELIKSDGKEELAVNGIINPEKGELESCTQKEQGSMKCQLTNQSLSELIESDGNEEPTVNGVINPDKRELESCIQKEQGSMNYHGSNHSPSELIKSDAKEELAVNGIINPEKGELESCTQKEQGSMKCELTNQSLSELIESDGNEELAVNGVINPDKRELESCIQKEQESMSYHGSNHSPSKLIKSVENLSVL